MFTHTCTIVHIQCTECSVPVHVRTEFNRCMTSKLAVNALVGFNGPKSFLVCFFLIYGLRQCFLTFFPKILPTGPFPHPHKENDWELFPPREPLGPRLRSTGLRSITQVYVSAQTFIYICLSYMHNRRSNFYLLFTLGVQWCQKFMRNCKSAYHYTCN